jgi:beta-glucosidase
MFSRKPGATHQGDTGDIACDHYHRYKEDIALMKELGVKGYRLSIAWPRILPTGTGAVEKRGIAFYDKLIDSLLEAGIQPWVTLFHWDYPLDLYHQGGWLNPSSPKWFQDYTRVVVDALSDRVSHWMTQNEPQCYIGLGLHTGQHAPGDKLRWNEVLLATHHSLLAHGLAVQAIRERAKLRPSIGLAPVTSVSIPHTSSKQDIAPARQSTFEVTTESVWQPSWWLDPIFLGHYPEDGLKLYGDKVPKTSQSDFDIISQPVDFYGMNIYHGKRVKATKEGKPIDVKRESWEAQTAFKWAVEPECLYWAPKFYYERYKTPIVVTENGMSNQDWVALDGHVHDGARIDFLHRHLREFKRAGDEGVPLQGYFQWSLMDNYEWAEGYKERFGIIYVDYATQKRTPKDSYHWYKGVIKGNGESL